MRLKEQLKGVASVFFNLGAATIGASAARFLFGSGDWIGVGWIAGAIFLIWLGTRVLTLMEAES